ncbi:MAG TPA: TonB-dependent receptor plug domain-containing protein, partial [Longimicrobiaceae bacterium]|nr:TonB-dependent receptor plug domain-containing protein [Longimicrobiaceae bacterium]
MFARRALLLLLAALAGAAEAPAQVRPDTLTRDSIAVPLPEVRVRVARPLATAGGASAVLVAIDSLRLAPAPTLEQVMRELPFVQVRENSRGEAQLSLRGSEARQVAVLVDGVPLSLGWDHRADLSVVPVAGAQSVLLVRGLSSVLHGPNVLGGVVEVGVSQGPFPLENPEPLRLRAGVDHLGGRALGVVGATLL